MIITNTTQIESEKLLNLKFNLSFYGCGYEKRSAYLYKLLNVNLLNNFVLAFGANQDKNFIENLNLFKENPNNNIIISDGEKDIDIYNSLNDFLKEQKSKEEINILIDYSSMTKIWMSAFLKYLVSFNSENISRVNLYYSYSHSKFSIPTQASKHGISVMPMDGFCKLSLPDKPTALIIGLGYDKNMATGLSQYLDAESYIFHTDNSYSNKYRTSVLDENVDLLREVKEENIYEFPILDINYTQSILHSLLTDLLQTNRIVLAPCGPKIFTLLCLVESLILDNVDVWRISSSVSTEKIIDKLPDGKISVLKITFEN